MAWPANCSLVMPKRRSRPANRLERASSSAASNSRPQHVGEIELRVGELPQQEIADALLAAGADEQIRLGRVASARYGRVGFAERDLGRPDAGGRRGAAGGLRDVPAAAVVGGNRQRATRVLLVGAALGFGDQATQFADRTASGRRRRGAHAVARRACQTSCSSASTNSSIRIDTSSAGRRQFSRAEREQRQVLDAALAAGLHDVARTASTPARWPATRGMQRCLAQRPLPSMMMATWRGTARECCERSLSVGVARDADARMVRQTAIISASFGCTSLSISAM